MSTRMDVLERLNTSRYNTTINRRELDLANEAWTTARKRIFDEIAQTP